MERTKANFKALRETIGMSQQVLADLMGVNKRSVKRWENPRDTDYGVAPEDAWNLLDRFLEQQQWAVDAALDKLEETEDNLGSAPRHVSLTYWISADEYEQAHPGEGPMWQMANANSRLVASILRSEGYDVNFDFEGLRSLEERMATR